ncbi:Protein of unknown function [Gryllus bimaculatus]|nr:Protein of unknown function [Gryllus bimaculatus]
MVILACIFNSQRVLQTRIADKSGTSVSEFHPIEMEPLYLLCRCDLQVPRNFFYAPKGFRKYALSTTPRAPRRTLDGGSWMGWGPGPRMTMAQVTSPRPEYAAHMRPKEVVERECARRTPECTTIPKVVWLFRS